MPSPPTVEELEHYAPPDLPFGVDGADHDGAGGGGPRFEVMYLLDAPDYAMPAFKDVWAGLGDSIVVIGGDGLWNCHIHTDDVGGAIEAALDAGRPRQIRVTDLAEQVEEERWVREGVAGGPREEAPTGPPPRTAVVAVANGDGIGRIFRSLGVRHLVNGGQSMNPSTADILSVVEAIDSPEVVLLPNNDNIKPVCMQVSELAHKTVRVVPTSGIVEGFAALSSTTRRPTSTATPTPWRRRPAAWWPARSPGRCATPSVPTAPSPPATGWGCRATASRSPPTARRGRRARCSTR